jgi:hypothetical protein
MNYVRALKICEELLSQAGPEPTQYRSAILGILGNALLLNGDPAGCVRRVIEAGGGPEMLAFEEPLRLLWLRLLTGAELARGDVAAAEMWAGRAASAVSPDRPPGQLGFALLARAEVHLARDDAVAAEAACEAAAAFCAARMPLYEATARLTAGIAMSIVDRQSEGLAQLERATALFTGCGATALSELADQEHHHVAARTPPPTTGITPGI